MNKYLLDTNICIFLLRGKYNVDLKIDNVGLNNCCISEITIAELKYGAELGKQKGLKQRIKDLNEFINSIEVVPIAGTYDLYASEKVRLRMAGTPIEDNFDLLIGCTAILHDMILVTENIKDFKGLKGIQIENWINRN